MATKHRKSVQVQFGDGARLKKLREYKGISRADLASEVGMTRVSLWRIEERGQGTRRMRDLVEALGESWTRFRDSTTTKRARN